MEPTSKCVVGTKIFIKHKEKVINKKLNMHIRISYVLI